MNRRLDVFLEPSVGRREYVLPFPGRGFVDARLRHLRALHLELAEGLIKDPLRMECLHLQFQRDKLVDGVGPVLHLEGPFEELGDVDLAAPLVDLDELRRVALHQVGHSEGSPLGQLFEQSVERNWITDISTIVGDTSVSMDIWIREHPGECQPCVVLSHRHAGIRPPGGGKRWQAP